MEMSTTARIERAISELEKLKLKFLKDNNFDGVDLVAHAINNLFKMQDEVRNENSSTN